MEIEFLEGKAVIIKWLDSHGITSEWEFRNEIKTLHPCLCVSIGFVEVEHKDYITIYQTGADKQVLGRMTIPRCSIISIAKVGIMIDNKDKAKTINFYEECKCHNGKEKEGKIN